MSSVTTTVKVALEAEEKKRGRKTSPTKPRGTQLPRPKLTKQQEYHRDVFQYLSGLTHAVERLHEIPVYLARFTTSPTFERSGITLHKWMHYHYSNFMISVGTVYDTALLLTNEVFILGLNPKNCGEDTVAKNRKVQGTKVQTSLNNLKEVTRAYREPRNLYVHRALLPSLGELDEYESILFIHREQGKLGIKADPPIPIRFVKGLYSDERRKLIRNVRDESVKIVSAVRQVFDALGPPYTVTTKHLD